MAVERKTVGGNGDFEQVGSVEAVAAVDQSPLGEESGPARVSAGRRDDPVGRSGFGVECDKPGIVAEFAHGAGEAGGYDGSSARAPRGVDYGYLHGSDSLTDRVMSTIWMLGTREARLEVFLKFLFRGAVHGSRVPHERHGHGVEPLPRSLHC